jgi:hypothetical protein
MANIKNGAKTAEQIPALIIFGRFPDSKVDQAAFFLQKDAEAANKKALDAGLSCLEVQTDVHRTLASTLPQGAINAHGRFSLSPASPKVIAELERLLKASTGDAATSTNTNPRTESPTISADLWQQLKPGSLVLAAGFDEQDNLAGWWEAIILRIDDGEFLVRWRDEPNLPTASRRYYQVFSVSVLAKIVPTIPCLSAPVSASIPVRDPRGGVVGREGAPRFSRPFSSCRMSSVSSGF